MSRHAKQKRLVNLQIYVKAIAPTFVPSKISTHVITTTRNLLRKPLDEIITDLEPELEKDSLVRQFVQFQLQSHFHLIINSS